MNSWEKIKSVMTDGKPGSVGYLADINRAATLFVSLNDQLLDKGEAVSAFNTDEEVRIALAQSDALKRLGILR